MEFHSELNRDVFGANCVNEGDIVPYIEEGEAMNAKISQLDDMFVLNFRRYESGNSLTIWSWRLERSLFQVKGRKNVLKRLDCRSCGDHSSMRR